MLLISAALRPAAAQNSDFGFLAGGVTGPRATVVVGPGNNTYVYGSVGGSVQFNYAWQVIQHSVDLYVELPVVIEGRDSGHVTNLTTHSSDSVGLFFTPGVRLKFSPEKRVSLYAALGGGIGSFWSDNVVTSKGTVSVSTGPTATPALDFGGGLDFRLTRLLSLRFEARDFVTRAGLGGASGMHRATIQLGVGFHF